MREEGLLTGTELAMRNLSKSGCGRGEWRTSSVKTPLKERLAILIEAARGRSESVDHVLFSGSAGTRQDIAGRDPRQRDGRPLSRHLGPALERPGDLAAVITNLDAGDVLFIDEVHRLPRQVEEVLYPAMEDFQLDIVVGKGPAAR